MAMIGLEGYKAMFRRLNVNRRRGQIAPHKAVMLLAVMDEVAAGGIDRMVPLSDRMVRAFNRCWNLYASGVVGFNPEFSTPFYHLDYEPFWELVKAPEWEKRNEYTLGQLRKYYLGAVIDRELAEYMSNPDTARQLRRVLLEQYLPQSLPLSIAIAADPDTEYKSAASSDAYNLTDMSHAA